MVFLREVRRWLFLAAAAGALACPGRRHVAVAAIANVRASPVLATSTGGRDVWRVLPRVFLPLDAVELRPAGHHALLPWIN